MSEHPEPIARFAELQAWLETPEGVQAMNEAVKRATETANQLAESRKVTLEQMNTPLYAHPVAAPPREPTEAMIAAYRENFGCEGDDNVRDVAIEGWQAMYDAGVAEIPKPTMSMYASREAMQADISKDDTAIERPNPAGHDTAKDWTYCTSRGYEIGEQCKDAADCARNGCALGRT